ncbi:MAG: class I SAM-dependent methyltransferase [Candidatus Limnocylindria bacterium]
MNRHEFLRQLHALARPRNYLEIGVNDGRSLSLSRTPSIAIDPGFRITTPMRCDLHLVKATSDEFFAGPDPIAHLRSGRNPFRNLRRGRAPFGHYTGGPILDLAFIDGMHLFEFALRDFMNVERFSDWTSLIALDDVLPRNVDEAARDRHTGAWTGDVYKITEVLREHRPDLILLPMDTEPTGVLVVLNADPSNRSLRGRYDDLVRTWATPDPQAVPAEVTERRGAVRPERFLASPILGLLVKGRGHRGWRRSAGRDRLRVHAADLLADR